MNSTITDLYLGNIQPFDKSYPRSSDYGKENARQSELYLKLEAVIPEESRSILEEYAKSAVELGSIQARDMFVEGFKLGARLMTEVLANEK